MNICTETYNLIINNVGNVPPESGGILGGQNRIINHVVFDPGMNQSKWCSYTPNVKMMNKTIERWFTDGIDFQGIFHTHFFGVDTLSPGDKEYIALIMKCMPPFVKHLYFPLVVLPERRMVVYKAIQRAGQLTIEQDNLVVGGVAYGL